MNEYSETLAGHISQDTAFVVNDYPYGYRLRTQIRYWIETKKGHGQRFVSQTLNPKNGKWNTPKISTYAPMMVMVRNPENGYVKYESLWPYGANEQRLIDFETRYATVLGADQRDLIWKARRALQQMQERREKGLGEHFVATF